MKAPHVCIVGGGPAGMMLGFLLARAGLSVVVLEKHKDFFRDFRGDTIHPSTLELMYELGLLDAFLKVPHDEITHIGGVVGGTHVNLADFTHLPTHCRFLGFMPQWDFLDFLRTQAEKYTGFQLRLQSEFESLIIEDGRVVGVRASQEEIRAALTVACDGRHSRAREQAGLPVHDLGAPMDVLWFRLERKPDDPKQALGYVDQGRILVLLARGDYWQCALIIEKGTFPETQKRGLEAFQNLVARIAPFLGERTVAVDAWNKVSLLSVAVDRLTEWAREGLLCIGDAAHAMSPVGGVGINLAVQDAVAAANLLYPVLARGRPTLAELRRVQARRELPTKLIQAGQLTIQKRIISGVLASSGPMRVPRALKWVSETAWLQRLPARIVGLGFRPEHIHTPEVR